MIISPPLLKAKQDDETDAEWLERIMVVVDRRGYPLNGGGAWHGGIHIRQTDEGNYAERVRAIADGTVTGLRISSGHIKRDQPPLNLHMNRKKGSDDGYVLLRHETETGRGDSARVVFYSLYMHMKSHEAGLQVGDRVYRKASLGTAGMVDGVNAFHFQIFCDDGNICKLTGRNTRELDISHHGRTDAVYGDIHFYLPAGTPFYDKAPAHNSLSTRGLSERYTSRTPLYVSMTPEKGNCIMVTRQKNAQTEGKYDVLGEPLVNADGSDYEYNLYKTAMRNYQQSPGAGYELLRFGRVINTEHETLVPASAPLWMTVSYPGGKGVVNLADEAVKKFSDADFPHWTGWQLADDDKDSNSQCHSALIRSLREGGDYDNQCAKLICHFPFEWEKTTLERRFAWLKQGNRQFPAMTEEDYRNFQAHAGALCFDSGALSRGRLWHFEPKAFIRHFRECGWVDCEVIEKVMLANAKRLPREEINIIKNKTREYYTAVNIIMNKYNFSGATRISHFLGQGAVESDYLRTMQETSQEQFLKSGMPWGGIIINDSTLNENTELGHWYGFLESEKDVYFPGKKYNSQGKLIAGSYSWKNGNCGDIDAQKFRGRGFKMITGLDTYSKYWVYRGWLSEKSFDNYWWDDSEYKRKNVAGIKKRVPKIDSPQKITENPYNCIDTGGFFIAGFKTGVLKAMDADRAATSDDDAVIDNVTRKINGSDTGLAQRKIATKKAKELTDDKV